MVGRELGCDSVGRKWIVEREFGWNSMVIWWEGSGWWGGFRRLEKKEAALARTEEACHRII